MTIFLEEPDWSQPVDFPELSGTIALDFETRDPALKTHGSSWAFNDEGFICGVAIAADDWKAYYPIRHKGGGNLPEEMVLGWLADQLKKPDLEVVVHNGLYELGWLRRYNIDVKAKVHDTMTAAPLIDENRLSYSLESLLKSYNVGVTKKVNLLKKYLDAHGLKDSGDMWRMKPCFVGEYAEDDAAGTLALWKKFKGLLDKDKLWKVYDLEIELLPLIVEMRRRGVRVDEEETHRLVRELKQREEDIAVQIKKECGRFIDIWSSNDIAVLFDAKGLEYPRTAKTNAPSFTQKWLDKHPDPIAKLIVKARKANKNRTTFLEGYVLGHVRDGRIHAEFAPLRRQDDEGGSGGTVTGRFSSLNPNLQNLPSLDKDRESGLMIRSVFLPEEGERWAAADYSQQEPRLTIHYACIAKCTGAEEAAQKYRDNPATDYHTLIAELTGLDRKQAKPLNLGMAYGMGGAKLCHSLGLPTKWIESRSGKMIEVAGDEGQIIIDKYNENAPFIKELFDECAERAEKRGFIVTIGGRRRRFKSEGDLGFAAFPHKAMNALIQGSAADQVKRAMLDMWKEGIVPLVTVHDEVGISTNCKELTNRVVEIMLTSTPLLLPLKVDVEVGKNWGDANATKATE